MGLGFFMAVIMDNCLKIVTYNLHCFNNGCSCLVDLCNDPCVGVIALQDHWLSPDRLHLLNEVHPDFSGCSISPMSDKWVNEIFRGRPYGAVGFLNFRALVLVLRHVPEELLLCC